MAAASFHVTDTEYAARHPNARVFVATISGIGRAWRAIFAFLVILAHHVWASALEELAALATSLAYATTAVWATVLASAFQI